MRKPVFFAAVALSACLSFCSSPKPRFSVVVLGCEGGLAEGNLSCYLLTKPGTGKYVALDAGTVLGGLRAAQKKGSLADCQPEKGSSSSPEGWVLQRGIKAYLISHAHIDHVSGLVIDSTDDHAKPLMGLNPTINYLRDHLFNWKTWPNFGSEGERPMRKYTYTRLQPQQEVSIPDTEFTVTPFLLSHSDGYPSTAFLVRCDDQYLLYCGDTGPDEVEKTTALRQLWTHVAPLVKAGKLRAIFLEASFPDGRADNELYGHLTPRWMMKELRVLSELAVGTRGLTVAVTHIKPSLDSQSPRQQIEKQLREQNDLGIRFVFPQQGERLNF